MKMREHNTMPDPDKAYLTWALIEDRARLTNVMNHWLLMQPYAKRSAMHAACIRILTEAKRDG
jgi:hypothetical protein